LALRLATPTARREIVSNFLTAEHAPQITTKPANFESLKNKAFNPMFRCTRNLENLITLGFTRASICLSSFLSKISCSISKTFSILHELVNTAHSFNYNIITFAVSNDIYLAFLNIYHSLIYSLSLHQITASSTQNIIYDYQSSQQYSQFLNAIYDSIQKSLIQASLGFVLPNTTLYHDVNAIYQPVVRGVRLLENLHNTNHAFDIINFFAN